MSLFHKIRASVTYYFLFNLQGKNAQICAFFPVIKTLKKTNFCNHSKLTWEFKKCFLLSLSFLDLCLNLKNSDYNKNLITSVT